MHFPESTQWLAWQPFLRKVKKWQPFLAFRACFVSIANHLRGSHGCAQILPALMIFSAEAPSALGLDFRRWLSLLRHFSKSS